MTEHASERRRFKRIAFDAHTELRQGIKRWNVKLIDLSLKGVLVERPQDWDADPGMPVEVTVHLSNQTEVAMEVRAAQIGPHQLGFVCEHISLDSISHLRRLIELNLGDPTELERELGALMAL